MIPVPNMPDSAIKEPPPIAPELLIDGAGISQFLLPAASTIGSYINQPQYSYADYVSNGENIVAEAKKRASGLGGTIGGAVGTAIGGPLGGAILGGVGQLLGGLFGGKKAERKQDRIEHNQAYRNNEFQDFQSDKNYYNNPYAVVYG